MPLILFTCIKKKNKPCTSIGDAILNVRKVKGYTQDDLAPCLDNRREYISRIERGLVDLRFSSLEKIAEALEVSINELICKK